MPIKSTRFMTLARLPKILSWALIVLFALGATVYQVNLGVFFTWDSDWYLISANKLSHVFALERPALYPPLFPLMLGLPQVVGIGALQSVYFGWFLSFFVIAAGAYQLSRSAFIAALALLFLFATEATAYHFRYVWTEMGYAALLAIAVAGLFIYLRDTRHKAALFLFLIAFALLPLQRYIGAYMSFLLGLIFIGFSTDRKMLLQRSGMSFLAALPTGGVLLQNTLLSGHLTGERDASLSSFSENMALTWSTLAESFRGESVLIAASVVFGLIMMLNAKPTRRLGILVFLLTLLPIVQVFSQIFASSLVQIDQINARYFIVITPLVFINVVIIGSVLAESRRVWLYATAVLALVVNGVLGESEAIERGRLSASHAPEVQQYLASLPIGEVGVYADATYHQWAHRLLIAGIVPPSHCASYLASGDFETPKARFAPDCETLPGHVYRPVTTPEEASEFDVILILPLGRYFEFTGAMHERGYAPHQLDRFLVVERTR